MPWWEQLLSRQSPENREYKWVKFDLNQSWTRRQRNERRERKVSDAAFCSSPTEELISSLNVRFGKYVTPKLLNQNFKYHFKIECTLLFLYDWYWRRIFFNPSLMVSNYWLLILRIFNFACLEKLYWCFHLIILILYSKCIWYFDCFDSSRTINIRDIDYTLANLFIFKEHCYHQSIIS